MAHLGLFEHTSPFVAGEGTSVETATPADWLRDFHAGSPALIEEIYRNHFDCVARAMRSMLGQADRETAIHEVFLRLLTQTGLRSSFQGGDLGAWLAVVARNHAIDWVRRRNREVPLGDAVPGTASDTTDSGDACLDARVLVDRFRREVLPTKWAPVFETRFVRQLSQAESAAALGLGRTTLAYQERRVRRLFRRFMRRSQ